MGLLVLSRKEGQRIMIGDDISVMVVRIGPNAVRLGIDAPKEMNIARQELIGKVPYQQAGVDDIADLGRRPIGEIEADFVADGACVIDDPI